MVFNPRNGSKGCALDRTIRAAINKLKSNLAGGFNMTNGSNMGAIGMEPLLPPYILKSRKSTVFLYLLPGAIAKKSLFLSLFRNNGICHN